MQIDLWTQESCMTRDFNFAAWVTSGGFRVERLAIWFHFRRFCYSWLHSVAVLCPLNYMYSLGRCSRACSRLRPPLHNVLKQVVPKLPRSRNWRSGSNAFSTSAPTPPTSKRTSPWISYPATLLLLSGATWYAYENYQPFRHTVLAVVRCSRVGGILLPFVLHILIMTINISSRCFREKYFWFQENDVSVISVWGGEERGYVRLS